MESKSPNRQTNILLLAEITMALVLFFPGCGARLTEAPQTNTVYKQTGYQGQVPAAIQAQLDARFPPSFWKQQGFNIAPEDRMSVGIRQFMVITQQANRLPDLGQMITEIFTTAFMQSELFTVVERQQLKKVLNEHELNQSGIMNPETAEALGNITGLKVLVTGSISQIGNNQRIDARAIDLSTGQVLVADRLPPIFNSQNVNIRPINASNINSFAHQFVRKMAKILYGQSGS
jgi:curli biogenesis system outer membrane secretion channel CsgG